MVTERWDLGAIGTRPYSDAGMHEQSKGYFNLAMDVGSTSERTLVYADDLTEMSTPLVMESQYTPLTRDTTNIKSASSAIEDNLEIKITPQDKTHIIGESIRIFKGSLRKAMNGTFMPMSSSTSKVEQTTTYINIYANAALAILYTMIRDHTFTHECHMKLTVSLPCEDLENVDRKSVFTHRLCGRYHIEFPRLSPGAAFDLVIAPEDVLVDSETNAVIYHYFTKHQRVQEGNVLFIEGGGRNLAFGCVQDGIILQDMLISTAGGGTKFHDLVGKEITNRYNFQKPKAEFIERILETGYTWNGAEKVSVIPAINAAKEEYVSHMMSGLMQALDQAQLSADSIQCIVCNGRLFKSTNRKNSEGQIVEKSPSLVDYLKQSFNMISPQTKFELLCSENEVDHSTDYPIPEGLIAIRLEYELGEGA